MPGLLLEMDSQGAPVPKVPEYGFVVSHQKLELEIDFSTQSLIGLAEITILPLVKDLRTIKIDARQCEIPQHKVMVNGWVAGFAYEDPMKVLDIPEHIIWGAEQYEMQRDRLKPLIIDMRAKGALEINIPRNVRIVEVDPFSGNAAPAVTQQAIGALAARNASIAIEAPTVPISATSNLTPKTAAESSARFQPLFVSIPFTTKYFRDGLQFVGMTESDGRFPHVYTKHSMDPGTASCIFPCVDDPAMRCTWEISIKCSRTLGDAVKLRPAPHTPKTHHDKNIPLNKVVDGTPVERYEVSLVEEEKLLEMTVICSGENISETDNEEDSSKKIVTFLCGTVVAAQHIGFSIGPFEQVDLTEYREDETEEKLGQGQALQMFGYALPGRGEEVKNTCQASSAALDWFMLSFGTYPFSDYSVVFVDDQIRETEHTASLSICSTRLLYNKAILDPQLEITRTLVHAIASQWVGVSLVPNQRSDRWLTVGLSHFMTGLHMKHLGGNNDYQFRQKILADRLVEQDVDRPSLHALGETLHLGSFEMDFMTLKAPLVLFILDRRLVKATGTAGLTRIIAKIITGANIGTTADSVLSTEGFRRTCEKITRYRATEAFWNQWILGAGCPKLSISQKFNKKRLCVEMTISQKQETVTEPALLKKPDFMRELKEDLHGVYAGEVQSVFTGPLTIRIHEADGTPYEHIVEIREAVTRIEIPYNTKYKRLKRSRRQKERLNAGAPVDLSGEGGDDTLYYCLGDVLQTPAETALWGLQDWDADTEARMDQESYEWIRMDADFEWICEKNFTSMPAYMHVSQLQQDRDVVAQQESMLYLKNMSPHPLCATFLVRTLMDHRYFWGIRVMAAEALRNHATLSCNWAGSMHLTGAYKHFFCNPTPDEKDARYNPRPNDFRDMARYKVELAIPRSAAMIRDNPGNCPLNVKNFIWDLYEFNNNAENFDSSNILISDNFKIATLLSCLTDSIIPGKQSEGFLDVEGYNDNEEIKRQKHKTKVVDELDRVCRLDEYRNSYQNILTITILDCKVRLMKAKVIPVDGSVFGRYLHDATSDQVRIKAFEALVEIGYMTKNTVLKLLLNVLSTDPSPYVRDQVFGVFCLGLAAVAFAEGKPAIPTVDDKDKDALEGGDGDGLLVVEQDANLELRKENIARTTTIEGALAALKEELQSNMVLKEELWEAIKSMSLGANEQLDLLDICGIIYTSVESMIVKLKYPRYWEVKNVSRGILHFTQTGRIRKRPLKSKVTPQPKPLIAAAPPKAVAAPKVPTPQPVVPKPNPSPLILKIGPGAMRPPKRPLEKDPNEEVSQRPPRKIVKLRVRSSELERIGNSTPKPVIFSSKSSIKSESPAPRASPAPKASSAPKTLSGVKTSPALKVSSTMAGSPAPSTMSSASPATSTSGTTKIRKPLPDAAPRSHVEATPPPAAPAKKKLLLKLNLHPRPQQPPP